MKAITQIEEAEPTENKFDFIVEIDLENKEEVEEMTETLEINSTETNTKKSQNKITKSLNKLKMLKEQFPLRLSQKLNNHQN